MNSTTELQSIAPNLWFMHYPLKMLGVDFCRNVTLIRLNSGKLIIHSTADFSTGDVAAISALGEAAWIVDVLLRHDTFAKQGRQAFPQARFLAPGGFSKDLDFETERLVPPPAEWAEEVEVLPIDGAPAFSEIVMLHKPSRTLIVGDLLFHFEKPEGFWKKFLLKVATVGGRYTPGVTFPFKNAIKDTTAYARSINTILSWDFDRIIVGHGVILPSGGKEKLRQTVRAAGIPGV